MNKQLYSWFYIYKPLDPVDFNIVQKNLTFSSRYNKEHGISGALIYDQRHFIHYIEGKMNSIIILRDNIESDKELHKIHTISFGEIAKRHFKNWTMSYINHDMYKKIIPSLEGFNPYATDSKKLLDIIETIQIYA